MNIRDNRYIKSPPRFMYTRVQKYFADGALGDTHPFDVIKPPHSEVKSGNVFMFVGEAKQPCWLTDPSNKKRLKINVGDILLWKYAAGFEIKKISQKELNSLELY